MPILGSAASTGGGGTVQRGVIVPKGALDRWGQAKTLGASGLFEVAIFGDSTTYGSSLGGSADPFYTWIRRLRELSVAAGVPDGGYGIYNPVDRVNGEFNAAASGYPKTSAITGWSATAMGSIFGMTSNTPGDVITVQGEGTAIRLMTYRGAASTFGSLSYSIDGGTAVPVTLTQAASGSVGYINVPIYIGGLTNGVHSVTVTNTSASSSVVAEFNVEFLNSAGVVYHRDALAGTSSGTWSDSVLGDAKSLSDTPVRLGLVGVTNSSSSGGNTVNGYSWGAVKGSNPLYRNVGLTIVQIGTNDINAASATDSLDQYGERYLENVALHVRTARAVGSDVILACPPYTAAVHPQGQRQHGRFKSALLDVALSHGCAYADFQEALGWDVSNWQARGYGNGNVGNPHLPKVGYQAEAAFLWNSVLAPALL